MSVEGFVEVFGRKYPPSPPQALPIVTFTRVKQLVATGKTLDEVKRERPTRSWDERFPKSFVTSDHVAEEAYRAVRP